MFPIPEWAPAVHPLIVHFPLALLFAAVAVDAGALLLPRWPWLRPAATGLFVVGAASAVVAFYTGRSAADGAVLPAAADPVLSEHATWAARTAWYYGLYALVRVVREWRYPARQPTVDLVAVVLGLAGLPLLVATGERGAQLVYQHGVGVQAVIAQGTAHDHDAHPESEERRAVEAHDHGAAQGHEGEITQSGVGAPGEPNGSGTLEIAAGGSWSWTPEPGPSRGLLSAATWLQGQSAAVTARPIEGPAGERALALQVNRPALLVAGEPLGDVQVQLRVRLDDWQGALGIVHHVASAGRFDALQLQRDSIALVRIGDGEAQVLDRAEADLGGWRSVRLVADGSHLRGYVDDRLVVHGHAAAGPPGRVGLRLDGTGRVDLAGMTVAPFEP